jgi:hypothetical protein
MDNNSDNNIFRFSVLRLAADEDGGVIEVRSRPAAIERSASAPVPPSLADLQAAYRELSALNIAKQATVNSNGNVVLNDAGLASVSQRTRQVAERLGRPLGGSDLEDVRAALLTAIRLRGRHGFGTPPANGPTDPRPAHLHAVGIAELLVVKQQIKRYEPGEVAYIENVLAGETKSRTTRTLDRVEETIISIEERERDRETENQSTERFELNRESSRTQQKDQKTGFGLSLSGRYGPSVDFSSNLDVSSGSTDTTTQSLSVQYAKDVVERSKETVVERVHNERRVTILSEIEETTDRAFANPDNVNRSGSYQFVDKIYESQVFNYGLRQIFDFMVPEPASYLWYLEDQPNPDLEVPVPPIPLASLVASAGYIDESNYLPIAATYQAQGVKAPPPLFVRKIVHVAHGTGGEDAEEGKPMGIDAAEIEIPDGYQPWLAFWSAMGTTDDVPTISVSLGNANDVWSPADTDYTGLDEGDYKVFRTPDPRTLFGTLAVGNTAIGASQKLTGQVIGFETANYAVDITAHFFRSSEAYAAWQQATYDTIADAYANALLKYQQDVDVYRQKQTAAAAQTLDLGDNPSINDQVILRELKKHCLAFIRNQHLGATATPFPVSDPPEFDIAQALIDGKVVRFLELAFEWDQLQYVVYPYYWARPDTWSMRFRARNVDPVLQEFLGAGSARVVVPVRKGFQSAVSFYMITGKVYGGTGDPDIVDPLYTPILTEIEERTGADQGETAVGDPWETRLPTSLLYVRPEGGLPSWRRESPDGWHWIPND